MALIVLKDVERKNEQVVADLTLILWAAHGLPKEDNVEREKGIGKEIKRDIKQL